MQISQNSQNPQNRYPHKNHNYNVNSKSQPIRVPSIHHAQSLTHHFLPTRCLTLTNTTQSTLAIFAPRVPPSLSSTPHHTTSFSALTNSAYTPNPSLDFENATNSTPFPRTHALTTPPRTLTTPRTRLFPTSLRNTS